MFNTMWILKPIGIFVLGIEVSIKWICEYTGSIDYYNCQSGEKVKVNKDTKQKRYIEKDLK
jgi:hypothetical protein